MSVLGPDSVLRLFQNLSPFYESFQYRILLKEEINSKRVAKQAPEFRYYSRQYRHLCKMFFCSPLQTSRTSLSLDRRSTVSLSQDRRSTVSQPRQKQYGIFQQTQLGKELLKKKLYLLIYICYYLLVVRPPKQWRVDGSLGNPCIIFFLRNLQGTTTSWWWNSRITYQRLPQGIGMFLNRKQAGQ